MNVRTSKDLTITYNKSVTTLLANLFENFDQTSCEENIKDPIIHIAFLPCYNCNAGLKKCKSMNREYKAARAIYDI